MQITAPMIKIPDSERDAISKSKGPQLIFDDVFRIKMYVKDFDAIADGGWRAGEFMFPWAYVMHKYPKAKIPEHSGYDGSMRGNYAFLGDLAKCNLSCSYCYVPSEDFETVDVTPAEYIGAFRKFAFRLGVSVLRVTGGEPFLYQEWLSELIRLFSGDASLVNNVVLWISTNGALKPTEELRDTVSYAVSKGVTIGIVSCFHSADNGLTAGNIDIWNGTGGWRNGRWDSWLANQKRIAALDWDVFFSLPSVDVEAFVWDALEEMDETIGDGASLRTQILKIKRYPTNRQFKYSEEKLSRSFSAAKEIQSAYLASVYPPHMRATNPAVVNIVEKRVYEHPYVFLCDDCYSRLKSRHDTDSARKAFCQCSRCGILDYCS